MLETLSGGRGRRYAPPAMAADAPDRPDDSPGGPPGGDRPDLSGAGSKSRSWRGRVLVASRRLRDRNFFRTLVLLIEHGGDGAMGLVVNRPTDATVRDTLAGHFEVPEGDPAGDAAVYAGGPVEPNALFVLHNSEAHAEGERPLVPPPAPRLFAGHSREAFAGLVEEAGALDDGEPAGNADAAVPRYRVFAGCAGWGPGQLEGELARGDWRLAPGAAVLPGAADPADPVFGPDPYPAWHAATARLTPGPPGGHRWN